jgi:hypothetical protein
MQAYLASRWGTEDYLLSLVRFLFAASAPERSPANASADRHVWRRSRPVPALIQLSPSATVLRDIHPCPQILQVLSAAPAPETAEVPEKLRAQRGHILMLPSGSHLAVRNFTISDASVRLLDHLAEPRSVPEIAKYIGVDSDHAASLDAFLGQLVDLGVLQRREPCPTAKV